MGAALLKVLVLTMHEVLSAIFKLAIFNSANCRNLFPLGSPICAQGAHLDKPTVYNRNYLARKAVYIENKYLFEQEQSLI